ncbi:hypothetical protein EZS27_031367 [termite gut metagenome]|uniref:Uncharacterized protein n=1 Tax=termite gut metagenome TaxID=433724 RepID=A0A5J4QAH0_9ZZZZ
MPVNKRPHIGGSVIDSVTDKKMGQFSFGAITLQAAITHFEQKKHKS